MKVIPVHRHMNQARRALTAITIPVHRRQAGVVQAPHRHAVLRARQVGVRVPVRVQPLGLQFRHAIP